MHETGLSVRIFIKEIIATVIKYKGLLIYNPTAGSFPSGITSEQVASLASKFGWSIEISASRSGSHVTQLANDAAQKNYDAVFIAGGDGTVSLAVAGLINSDTALGVLPGGTSNVLAQELGIASVHFFRANQMLQAAEKLVNGDVYLTDVGLCNKKPFYLWAGIGLDGFIVHRVEPRKSWEKQFSVLHYASKAVWNVHFWNGMKLSVETEDSYSEGNFLMAVASNIRLYVGGFAELSPSAMLDDGMMDLWLIEGNSPIDLYQRALSLFTHRHVNSDSITCKRFNSATIHSDGNLYTQLDAEPYNEKDKIDLVVLPQSLKLIVPTTLKKKLFINQPVEKFNPH